MFHDVFGDVVFKHSWRGKDEIQLWGEDYEITVNADANRKSELISDEQEMAYAGFKRSRPEKQKQIESMLSDYYGNRMDAGMLRHQLTPKTLVIERGGGVALLLQDREGRGNGLAVVLSPDEDVMTQDEYL